MKGSERRRETISRIPVHIYIHISRGSFRGESRTGPNGGAVRSGRWKKGGLVNPDRRGNAGRTEKETLEGRAKKNWTDRK